MSEPMLREWRFYLDDMIGFAERALAYTENFDQSTFVTNGLTYDATVRNLELIGEAATHIPDTVRQTHPHIPWRLVIATRNRLIHGYLGIDNDTLWSIIQDELPRLLNQLRTLRESLK
jgi:uncharacterized protein with HEPN domain